MKNEETFQCNEISYDERNEETTRKREQKMKKACHSAIGRSVSFRKHSSFFILHSSFSRAFTLLEVMIATALFGLVVAGTISVYIMCNKIWHSTSISMQAVRESSLALSRLVYGQETNSGLRSASMIILDTNYPGGCWMMTVSNLFGGVKYAAYNSYLSNMYFGPDTNDPDAIICKDVSSATVTTNAGGTVRIQLTVAKRDGMFTASNTVSTLVNMRNKP